MIALILAVVVSVPAQAQDFSPENWFVCIKFRRNVAAVGQRPVYQTAMGFEGLGPISSLESAVTKAREVRAHGGEWYPNFQGNSPHQIPLHLIDDVYIEQPEGGIPCQVTQPADARRGD